MGIDLTSPNSIYRDLCEHVGHKIECFAYQNNATIECVTCSCVLIDGDGDGDANDFVCPAEIHRDDFQYHCAFDAEFFFRSACDKDIRALVECGWRGDFPADEVARICSSIDTGVKEVLDQCTNKEGMGFEVSVDKEKALHYLWDRRPSLMREIERWWG